MMQKTKFFWLRLCFLNLGLVALMGFLLRTKILFSLPFLDYKNLLNAHSHLAFSGWVGLALLTFLIYDVLPKGLANTSFYQGILWSVEITSVGMALSFPFWGYAAVPIVFSTLYIFTTYVFGWAFFSALRRTKLPAPVRWLSLASILSLMLSSVGPFGLAFMMARHSVNSLLYRDFIYTFLHLQYNGFFTLGVFALFFQSLSEKTSLPPAAKPFSALLIASVVPALFLSLLWHNLTSFYVLATVGCLLILASLAFFLRLFQRVMKQPHFENKTALLFCLASFVSFALKMALTVGTLYRPLGNAVYGARPVIIGFLHLVFLGFVSFFIFSRVLEANDVGGRKLPVFPFYLFGFGVAANEALLALQGLEILFQTNSSVYNGLLWMAAMILLLGAASLALVFSANKKATDLHP